ncbi:epoxide hydrolase EphA [soil metagenome]
MSAEIRTRRVAANGIELDVHEAGRPGDPVVLLLHGFPECAYSWRHQMGPVADAGYHVLAPDQRGYGGSDAPDTVEAYHIEQLTGDLLGLLDDVDAEQAVVVGHDWGALVAWDMARMFPQRIGALVAVSVPYTPWPAAPTDVLRHIYGDNFFYVLYFQQVGPPEAELESDVRRSLHHILWGASGENFPRSFVGRMPAAGTGFLDVITAPDGTGVLPHWLTAEDLDVYVEAFQRSGFFGPISWYRNLDANYADTKHLPAERMVMPTYFVAGSNDLVIHGRPERVAAMEAHVPDLRRSVILDGIGHWTQQEDPNGFNEALLGFLAEVGDVRTTH